MKKHRLMFLGLMLGVLVYGQDKKTAEVSKSQTVEILSKDGMFLEKESFPIGVINNIKFENLILLDIAKNIRVGALRIITQDYSPEQSFVGTLDADEIGACIKALNYIKTKISDPNISTKKEYIYTTKDGVQIGSSFYDKDKNWLIFVFPKKYISRSFSSFKFSEMDNLISILEKSSSDLTQRLSAK